MLIGPFSPNILSGHFGPEIGSRTFIPLLEALVGAGISGINIGKRLLDIGVRRYTILEQGSEVGGTWFWNKYPGCCSDVPAVLYSFSWHYNPAWTRRFPGADEIQVNLL